MPASPLSLAEVLEQEYTYFYGAVPPRQWKIEAEDLRDVDRLLEWMDLKTKVPRRYELLREPLGPPELWSRMVEEPPNLRLLSIMNLMLGQENLLSVLVEDPEFKQLLQTPDGKNLLARLATIPKARRLLLDLDETQRLLFDDLDLLTTFIHRTPGMEHLVGDERIRRCVDAHPTLLSTIADDWYGLGPNDNRHTGLESYLIADLANRDGRRNQLAVFFGRTESVFRRAARGLMKPVPALRRFRPDPSRSDDLARNSSALYNALIEQRRPAVVDREPIPPHFLGHFNMLLIEFAYRGHINIAHDVKAVYRLIHQKDTAALCLSGGGIRSATFNLGVLQGLADRGVLSRVHYISTVSGGGYIGSWLSSWMRRHTDGPWGVCTDLCGREPSADENVDPKIPDDPLNPEPKPIQHLREYSSYLAPRRTATSPDTWTLFATYLRNLLLNWTMLLPALIAAVALPRLLESAVMIAPLLVRPWEWGSIGFGSVGLALIAVAAIAWLRPAADDTRGKPMSVHEIRKQARLTWTWLVPLYLSGCFFVVFWAALERPEAVMRTAVGSYDVLDYRNLAAMFAIGNALAALIYAVRRARSKVTIATPFQGRSTALQVIRQLFARTMFLRVVVEIVSAAAAGAAGAVLLVAMFRRAFPQGFFLEHLAAPAIEVYVAAAIPLFLFVFFVEAALLAGFTTSYSTDHDREWFARSAAVMFLMAMFHLAGTACVLLGPVLVAQLPYYIAAIGGVSAVVSWLLARSGKTAANVKEKEAISASARTARILTIATAACLVIVFSVISLLTTQLLIEFAGVRGDVPKDLLATRLLFIKGVAGAWRHLLVLRSTAVTTLLVVIALCAGVALIMSRILNVNIYSMHGMYRNRLIRAYLGASRWNRRPDPFTGFDPQDNLAMWELRPELVWASTFPDFDTFVQAVRDPGDGHLLRQLPVDVQAALARYGEDGAPTSDVRTDVIAALNRLMVRHDLRYDIDAPPSLELLRRNRDYLDGLYTKKVRKAAVDDVPMLSFARVPPGKGEDGRRQLERHVGPPQPHRERPPLHIVNTALNLVGGEKLAWQERKADSFTVSMLHAGNRRLGYRDTVEYGGKNGISLGTAMAISGAAVSPNMGYNSSPAVTFLMTLFNARLGWWLGNPGQAGRKTYFENDPKNSLLALQKEALGQTTDTEPYVFLSDGGHFENLGVYEMVLRRCRFIIACDASADRKYAFGDLANAVRKIRVDLGVPIEFTSVLYIGPQEHGRVGRYCALANIQYDRVDGKNAKTGQLLYIKPAVYEDCPPDVTNYQRESDGFPHETTADQFFSESQFESYRALGRHTIDQLTLQDERQWRADSVEDFFNRSDAYLEAQRRGVGNMPVTSISDLAAWMQRALA